MSILTLRAGGISLIALISIGCGGSRTVRDGGQSDGGTVERDGGGTPDPDGGPAQLDGGGICTPVAPVPISAHPDGVGPYAGEVLSLSVDGAGGVHIVYLDSVPSPRYAHRPASGAWVDAPLDVGEDGLGWSAALDADGGIHLAYTLTDPDDPLGLLFRHAYRPSGGAWAIATVDSADNFPFSVIHAQGGEVHLTYGRDTYSSTGSLMESLVRYAHGSIGGALTIDDVDSSFDIRGGSGVAHGALAVGAGGDVSILYSQNYPSVFRLAQKPAGGTWSNSPVGVDVGRYIEGPSLAVDGAGGLHAGYYTGDPGMLRYTHRPPGGAWSAPETIATSTVFTSVPIGAFTSIAVDSRGGVHVAHAQADQGWAAYSYRPAGGGWTTTPFDPGTSTAYDSIALAVDAQGGVHLAYYLAFEDSALRYVYLRTCP